MTEREQELHDALKDMFDMLDEGILVRDVSKDGQPDWVLRTLQIVRRLKKNMDALDEGP